MRILGTILATILLTGALQAQALAYSVGGMMSGLTPGDYVELENNGGDTMFVFFDGPFTFPSVVGVGQPYSVTVLSQPTFGGSCTITNGSGVMSNMNVTTVLASCSVPALQLTVTGSCPGGMLLAATNATPAGAVVFAYGTSGSFSVGGGTCNGLLVPIAGPTQLATIIAGQTGYASFFGNAPASACGLIQVVAVDVSTCTVTNAASI
jgi:hypothetical protein